jgi:hypothetical protein
MRKLEGRRIEPVTGSLITISMELGDLEKKAKYGSNPAARMRAARTIINRRNAYKRTLEGCGSIPTPQTREAFDMFKFAVERFACSQDAQIRGLAFTASGRNVISMKMISRAHPLSDVGKLAKSALRSMERPHENDVDGLVLFVPPKMATRKRD